MNCIRWVDRRDVNAVRTHRDMMRAVQTIDVLIVRVLMVTGRVAMAPDRMDHGQTLGEMTLDEMTLDPS